MNRLTKYYAALAGVMSLVAAGAEPTFVANQRGETTITVRPNDSKDTSAPVQSLVVPASMQYVLPRAFANYFRAQHPVWIGKQKRGNRRNRSRFSYFR